MIAGQDNINNKQPKEKELFAFTPEENILTFHL